MCTYLADPDVNGTRAKAKRECALIRKLNNITINICEN